MFSRRERRQYIFNDNVKDKLVSTAKHLLVSTAKHLEHVELPHGVQRDALEKVKEELQHGLELIAA